MASRFRTHRFRKLFAIGAAFLLAGCGDSGVRTAEFFVFGTIVEVSVAGTEPDVAEQAFAELQSQFQSAHRDWHAWEPGALTAINKAFARGETAAVEPELAKLIRLSQEAESLSGGRFNASIGSLVELWGFHTSDYPILGPPPDAASITGLVAVHPSAHDIVIGNGRVSSLNPAVQLDFGGIAKGYAVDRACESLKKRGIVNAIVTVGGDLRAYGSKGSQPWRVAIRNPFAEGTDGTKGTVLGVIEIQGDEAVSTSGNYQRFRETEKHERYAHILDPRTGWPVGNVVAATVVTSHGWKADAAATAFVVAGIADWAKVARAFGIDQVMLADASGIVHATPAMLKRLVAEDAEKRRIEVLDLTQ